MKMSFIKQIIKGKIRLYYLLIVLVVINMLVMCTTKNSELKYGLKLYVSPIGNDTWTGKFEQPNQNKTDGPFATLEGARDAIRKLKNTNALPKGNVIVEIGGGVYEMAGAFELDSIDGGKDANSRVIYLGKKGCEVRMVGGKNLTKWELVSDEDILRKFRPEARGKIYQSSLSALGVTDFGSAGALGSELFFNDKPMLISRYPNKDFVKITGLLNIEIIDPLWGTKGSKIGKFNYDDERISQWKDEKDAWVHGYWCWDWAEQREKIAKIDTKKKNIELVPPYHNYGYRIGQWFYGFNLLSEIDEPEEYYIDREKGIVYFFPPSDIEKGQAYVSLNTSLINMNKVSFLTIKGMILEGCRATAVNMRNCKNSLVVGCTIRNLGDWAVNIFEGISNGVAGCDISYAGAGGINIRSGDRKTLSPGKCFADNNYIHNIARLKRTYNPGIQIIGVGNRISHNVVAHVPHMAMGFGGNDHIIEYNEIYDAAYESNDAGAIYAGRDWTMRGNIIRYNYLHDISGLEGKGCVGVYLDDMFSSAEIIGNIFNKVTRPIKIGGGRDNSVVNNIFIDCVPSLSIDARALGWAEQGADLWIKEAADNGTISGTAYNKPPYSTNYPKLASMLTDEPKAPKGNVISNNICLGGNWDKPSGIWNESIEGKARLYLTMKNNIVSPSSGVEDSTSISFVRADPLFVNQKNPEKGKYQLRENSPALKLDFKQIPFEKIGLYESNDRASWPVSKK